ncbi:MAG: Flp pilus assembly complex ATPase component TadA, partial [Desulfobacterales bacterium]|nr:Flp pilus assembly complex ATPase component TadA [Desulfobacterales bacterium]
VGQLLVDDKKITEQQLETALEKQRQTQLPLLYILKELGYINENDALHVLSKHLNIPIISLDHFQGSISLQMAIGETFALKNKIIVIDDDLEELKLALGDPSKPLIHNLYHYLPKHKYLSLFISKYSEVEQQFERMYPYNKFIEFYPNKKKELFLEDNQPDGIQGILIPEHYIPQHDDRTLAPFEIKSSLTDSISDKPESRYKSYVDSSYTGLHLESEKSSDPSFGRTKAKDIRDELFKMEIEPDVEEEKSKDVYEIDGDSSAAAVKYVNKIIVQAHRMGASDIHFEPGIDGKPAVIRMRVDGACRKISEVPEKYYRAMISRIKIMTRMDISERRKPQDGKAKVKFYGKELGLRAASMPTVNGESMVLRLLASSSVLSIEKLNLSERNKTEIQKIIRRPYGIILVVGPTGSGKTTTLHSILAQANSVETKIWTAEDPVEITQPGLQQVQINHKIGLDFVNVLRSFLRLDPDVILIGEMRDLETSSIAIEASLTGHLVLSTLHTNSAPETITRLMDLGINPFSFSDALIAVLAQRLVRKLCWECKIAYTPEEKELDNLRNIYGPGHDSLFQVSSAIQLYRSKGCNTCLQSGYSGRIGIHELLISSQKIKEIIIKKGSADEIRKQAMAEGMQTLIQDGIVKILSGQIDYTQLAKVAAE